MERMASGDEQPAEKADQRRGGRSAPGVYVVDDHPATRDLLCEVARDAGWEARGFSRLDQLRSTLEEAVPTLIILDDDLPDGRGGDLVRELRAHPRMADLPLLVCTAAHPVRRAEIGAWAPVVPKPFDLAQIDAFLAATAERAARRSDDVGRGEAG